MDKTASNEIVLVSEMSIIIDGENVVMAPRQGKHQYHCCMMTLLKY